MKLVPLLVVVGLVLPGAAVAQSFNVDFGAAGTVSPSDGYGGVIGSPGVWNGIDPNGAQMPFGLVDLAGNSTGVMLSLPTGGAVLGNNPCLMGEEQALLDDFMDPLAGGTFEFTGLANGLYTVVCYSFAADDFTYTTDIDVTGASEGVQVVGGTDWCVSMMQAPGETYSLHTVDVSIGMITITYDAGATLFETFNGIQILEGAPQGLGVNYCSPVPNSTGAAGRISAAGSATAAANDFTLFARDLPPGQFGIFLAAFATDAMPVGGGVLCLGGPIGRFNLPGQILQADGLGRFQLDVDLGLVPTPSAFVQLGAGDTAYFQVWHRDGLPTAPSSNFTDGVRVDFL